MGFNAQMLDKTGLEIVDELKKIAGAEEEAEESDAPASTYNAPLLESTGQAILAQLKEIAKGGGILPAFDPSDDDGKVLTISDGAAAWVTPAS